MISPTAKRKKARLNYLEWTGLTLIVVVFMRLWILMPLPVVSSSMELALNQGEWVLFIRSSALIKAPQKGDLVVCYFADPAQYSIKRIQGLPNEDLLVKDALGDRKFTLGDNNYFVSGDNESNSLDSHFYGPLERKQIMGKALFVIWPLSALRWIRNNV